MKEYKVEEAGKIAGISEVIDQLKENYEIWQLVAPDSSSFDAFVESAVSQILDICAPEEFPSHPLAN